MFKALDSVLGTTKSISQSIYPSIMESLRMGGEEGEGKGERQANIKIKPDMAGHCTLSTLEMEAEV